MPRVDVIEVFDCNPVIVIVRTPDALDVDLTGRHTRVLLAGQPVGELLIIAQRMPGPAQPSDEHNYETRDVFNWNRERLVAREYQLEWD